MVLGLINYQIYKQVSGLKILLNIVNKIVGRKSFKLYWIAQAIVPRKYKMMAVGLYGAAGAPAPRHMETE